MLNILTRGAVAPHTVEPRAGWTLSDDVVWVDLVNPTVEEEVAAEAALGLCLPTREEMAEIETSSRLYRENGGVFMTASLLVNSDAAIPEIGHVTFVLAGKRLVTIRYVEPRAFSLFRLQVERDPGCCRDGGHVFAALLDAVIDRLADVLERASADIESLSNRIFRRPDRVNFRKVMDRLGKAQGINAKIRESAASLNRVLIYASGAEGLDDAGVRERLSSLQHDLHSLTDHSGYLAGNITFLLDAALGMINIEQNAIIKMFSIAAVMFLPPTLVASYFGMNFESMREFQWAYGEVFALGLMIVSVIAPLVWFKRKGWL